MSSRCNLQCRWCIGEEVQRHRGVRPLPNDITPDNVDSLINGILEYKCGGLKIEVVKFSGFTGEPLLCEATLHAMQRFAGAGVRVGLFTNGVLMTSGTWPTLCQIDYVHLSLDAGPNNYFYLKEAPNGTWTRETYETVIRNLSGLNCQRGPATGQRNRVKLNVGYVVIPANHEEVFDAARRVKDAGADSIRFKCDIGGKHRLTPAMLDVLFAQIGRAETELADSTFSVWAIHTRQEIEKERYAAWDCADGCYYQAFLGTVGSDGNLYLCDHNSLPGAVALGNVILHPFAEVWESERREFLAGGVKFTCQCSVCPPFGNRVNFFLKKVVALRKRYGTKKVAAAISQLRTELDQTGLGEPR